MLSSHIFRAYDIRGIYQKDFDEEGAKKIAIAYAKYLKNKYPQKGVFTVSIGRDGRISGEILEKYFCEGLMEEGFNVVSIGEVTSPMLYYSICAEGYDGGVMITASHNPAEYNGFKLQSMGAHAICGEEIQKIFRLTSGEEVFDAPVDEQGEVIKRSFGMGEMRNLDVQESYFSLLSEITTFPKTGKICIDAGNGIAGRYAPEFFKRAGFDVHPLYCEVDGNFPNHDADPEREENLKDLKKYVLDHKCDLGIAFDGDGDRVGIVDAFGNHFSADLLLLLLVRKLLSKPENEGTAVVYDLKATELLREEIEEMGGKAVMCKTGHSFVEEKMEETEAILGGEVSGHIFIADRYFGYDDALLAAAYLVEIAFGETESFTEILGKLPQTFVTPEIKIPVDEKNKFSIISSIVKQLQNKYPDALTIDGIRIDFGEGAWGIVRASNTSPYLTTRFEARSAEKLEEIQNIMNTVINAEVEKNS